MSLKKIITYPRLVIDNTFLRKINDLLEKQKKLIAGKIHLQNEAKEINKLLQQYEDNIIKIENKITNLKRRVNDVTNRTKGVRNIRARRIKT